MSAVTKQEVEEKFIPYAARTVAYKYARWGVSVDDCKSEILTWYYSDKGQKNITRWLSNDPQQTTRIRYTFTDLARRYAEAEKAQRLGYDPEDVQWYSASLVEALLPLALDPTFDGTGSLDYDQPENRSRGSRSKKDPAENNDLLAMVVDVRRALDGLGDWVREGVCDSEPGVPLHDSAVEAIVAFLGEPRPFTGRRSVKSNAQAQAETRSQADE